MVFRVKLPNLVVGVEGHTQISVESHTQISVEGHTQISVEGHTQICPPPFLLVARLI